MATTSSRPDTCNYHGFAPDVESISSGKLTSKIFSSVRTTGCLQRWNDCGTLSRARWQRGRGYKWDLLRMSDYSLFVFFLTLWNCPYRVFFNCTVLSFMHDAIFVFFLYALSLSLFVFFLALSHRLYRMFKCTTCEYPRITVCLFLTLSHRLYRVFTCTIISFMHDANSQHKK